ncbi:MAG: hypothetical protein M1833_001903 [Piccolia ochrophora]|nr:MAG: hypothetical protein M1833_001903 [Piccolia ochrophora]
MVNPADGKYSTGGSFSPTQYAGNDITTLDFLEKVTFGAFFANRSVCDWKYEWRRQAQTILPFLYLGPAGAARDREFLRREKITMLFAVRNLMSAQARLLDGRRVAEELGIQSHSLDVGGNLDFIAAFAHAINTINVHLSEVHSRRTHQNARNVQDQAMLEPEAPPMGKVLIYCESGNERSAGLVSAYLMAMFDMDVVQAIQIVQAQRFCASFDDSMKNLLLTYDGLLKAKREVQKSGQGQVVTTQNILSPSGPGRKQNKRGLDDAYDIEMAMGEASEHIDDGRFDQREGFAPFQDKAFE